MDRVSAAYAIWRGRGGDRLNGMDGLVSTALADLLPGGGKWTAGRYPSPQHERVALAAQEIRMSQKERETERLALQGGLKGLEKESLRVSPKGLISKALHPQALGSALEGPVYRCKVAALAAQCALRMGRPKAALSAIDELMPLVDEYYEDRYCSDDTFWTDEGRTAQDADSFLKSKGIILRMVGSYGLGHCLRMTIGTEDENKRVVAALSEFMGARG